VHTHVHTHTHTRICARTHRSRLLDNQTYIYPLTEEIRLKIFGSPDLFVFLIDLLSCGNFVYSRETFWGFPWKRVWCVRGLLWKLVRNLGSRNYFKSDLLRLLIHPHTYAITLLDAHSRKHINVFNLTCTYIIPNLKSVYNPLCQVKNHIAHWFI